MRNIFRQLRWKLTLSYTIVTVSALLAILLILAGLIFTEIFVAEEYLSPESMIEIIKENSGFLWRYILSQTPVDTVLINRLLRNPEVIITSNDFLRLGSVQFSVKTYSFMRALIIGADGTLLGTVHGGSWENGIGKPFDANQVPGLEAPLKAALAGETDASRLYTIFEPNEQFLLAIPFNHYEGGKEDQVVGVIAVMFTAFPTQGDIPAHILKVAGRSLLILLFGVGIMGALFGAFFAHGLASRFKQISATTDRWSEGDFSRYIDDNTGDEITQFTQRLNNMAKQLQSLLRRRQDMAVSEERNRLARDLHDSAKQQALAASLELGTALTLYERDPEGAKNHLMEADTLVDAVRKELTNLVDELRPQPVDGQDFSEVLKEYALEWSRRSGIEMTVNIEGNDELSPETRETLFRIAQEALANVARHSSASRTDVSLEYEANCVSLTIKDDGHGFDTLASQSGMGLRSMRERAEDLGGDFTIESEPGKGTKILLSLPKDS